MIKKLIPLNSDVRLSALRIICWFPPILLYLYYFYFIWRYAVDIPFLDEWEYFLPDALPAGLTLKWLFAFHNEHRIVFTKFLAWLFLKIDGLNFVHQLVFNYVIFGGLLAAVWYVKRITAGAKQFLFFPLFMIFLLSHNSFDNHTWAFQSQFHLTLLFAFLASAFTFSPFKGKNFTLSLIFTLFSLYSFSSGVVFAVIYLVCFSIYLLRNSRDGFVKREEASLACAAIWLIVGTGVFFYFKGYVKPINHSSPVFPVSLKYWEFYLNILSHGFGFYSINFVLGIPCVLISLFPLVILLIQKGSRWHYSTWMLITLTLAIHGTLAAVAFGRTGFGIAFSKESRYNEMAALLIPLSAVAWWLSLVNIPKLRGYFLTLIWVFCFIGYMDNWSAGPYIWRNKFKLKGVNCVSDYYKGIGYDNCPNIYQQGTLQEKLYYAKQLNVSFIKNILGSAQK